MNNSVTNADIIQRIDAVEAELKALKDDTKDMVKAFKAAEGAFLVLEWVAKAAKPIIVIVVAIGSFAVFLKGLK